MGLPDNGAEPFHESSLKIRHEKPMKVRSVEMRGDITLGQMARVQDKVSCQFPWICSCNEWRGGAQKIPGKSTGLSKQRIQEAIKQECQEALAISSIR